TALGDTVNTTARLQAEAKAGEIVISDALYQSVSESYPNLEQRLLTLRGRDEPINVRILRSTP
ncbi:MAG: adenylate/guanylate cyclase domain-containing protein, partial [Chloroflexi bacterium]|nr:adenylate/guanylate cyclase domain-containing protein [Chloroflexota bacterium]